MITSKETRPACNHLEHASCLHKLHVCCTTPEIHAYDHRGTTKESQNSSLRTLRISTKTLARQLETKREKVVQRLTRMNGLALISALLLASAVAQGTVYIVQCDCLHLIMCV